MFSARETNFFQLKNGHFDVAQIRTKLQAFRLEIHSIERMLDQSSFLIGSERLSDVVIDPNWLSSLKPTVKTKSSSPGHWHLRPLTVSNIRNGDRTNNLSNEKEMFQFEWEKRRVWLFCRCSSPAWRCSFDCRWKDRSAMEWRRMVHQLTFIGFVGLQSWMSKSLMNSFNLQKIRNEDDNHCSSCNSTRPSYLHCRSSERTSGEELRWYNREFGFIHIAVCSVGRDRRECIEEFD